MQIQSYLFALFSFIIIVFLALDLGYFNRKAHKVSVRGALFQTIFWISISLGFALLMFLYMSHVSALEFLSAYVTEKMLSVDNLFVILLIFNFFNLEPKYHHRVLFWGILGAIIFRASFILAGVYIVSKFHFVLYIFGAIILFTGIRLLFEKRKTHPEISENKVLKFVKKYFPLSTKDHNGKFFTRENGKLMVTTLFMVLAIVEGTDVIFSIDSIPVAFSISQNAFVLFTANIFAIMGLRSLFVLIERVMNKFYYLEKGLSFILIFVGAKMLLDIWHIEIHSLVSFGTIMAILAMSAVASMLFPKKI